MLDRYLEAISKQFNGMVRLEQRRTNLYQVMVPIFHEDGDMQCIFIRPLENNLARVCDLGKSLMRLSYTYDIDSDHKNEVFNDILASSYVSSDDGDLFIDVSLENLYGGIMQLSQVITKVTTMDIWTRGRVYSPFYEELHQFIALELSSFKSQRDYRPLSDNSDLVVDCLIDIPHRPIYLFGVKDNAKASRVTITCLQSRLKALNFRSVTVCEDIEVLSRFTRNQLLDTCDKPFVSLESFRLGGKEYLTRELA